MNGDGEHSNRPHKKKSNFPYVTATLAAIILSAGVGYYSGKSDAREEIQRRTYEILKKDPIGSVSTVTHTFEYVKDSYLIRESVTMPTYFFDKFFAGEGLTYFDVQKIKRKCDTLSVRDLAERLQGKLKTLRKLDEFYRGNYPKFESFEDALKKLRESRDERKGST